MKNINLDAVLKVLGVIVVADGFFLFLILYLCLILFATVHPPMEIFTALSAVVVFAFCIVIGKKLRNVIYNNCKRG